MHTLFFFQMNPYGSDVNMAGRMNLPTMHTPAARAATNFSSAQKTPDLVSLLFMVLSSLFPVIAQVAVFLSINNVQNAQMFCCHRP